MFRCICNLFEYILYNYVCVYVPRKVVQIVKNLQKYIDLATKRKQLKMLSNVKQRSYSSYFTSYVTARPSLINKDGNDSNY